MLKKFPKPHLIAACGFITLAAVGLMLSPSSEVEAQRVTVPLALDGASSTGSEGKLETSSTPGTAESEVGDEQLNEMEQVTATKDKPIATSQAENRSLANAGPSDTAEPAVALAPAQRASVDVPPELDWKAYTVQSGDTLSTLFRRAGFNNALMYKVIQDDGKQLARLYNGNEIRFGTDDGELQEVILVRSQTESLRSVLTDEGYVTEKEVRTADIELEFAAGEIENSLFLAGREAGLDSRTTMELAAIFGWDIDFIYDIRKGDTFQVLYETMHLDGENIGTGEILAATFVNRGREITAIRYTDEAGESAYYTPEGKSIQKAFLRAPIDARISSSFNLQRRHPVLNVVRPHEGTDYAAATGSPIMAAGDGRVRFSGWKGGYGRTIVLQHGNGITTLYAHLSKVAKGIKKGQSVKQGQTIGYVGSSGMVTGAHLHYEFRLHGSPRNSRTVDLPDAAPVPKQEMARFKAHAHKVVARLDNQSKDTQLALADED